MIKSDSLNSTPSAGSPSARKAIFAAIGMVVAMLIIGIMLIVADAIDVWQDYVVLGVAGGIALMAIVSALVSARGQVVWGMRLLLGTFLLGMVSAPLLVANVVWVVIAGIFAIVYVLAYLTLPERNARELLVYTGLVSVAMLIVDFYPPFPRLASFLTTTLVVNLTVALVLGVFGPLAVWQMQQVRLPVKMGTILLFFGVGLFTFSTSTLATLREVEIGSELYQEITDGKDLVADILPPPGYLVEAHLNTDQIRDAVEEGNDPREVLVKAANIRAEFIARHEFWQARLLEHSGRDATRLKMQEAYQLGLAYLDQRDQNFIPALQANNLELANEIHKTQLEPLFAAHSVAINEAVDLAQAGNVVIEAQADQTVANSLNGLTILVVVIGALSSLIVFFISRSVVNPINQLSHSAESLARGELTAVADTGSADEVGLLARTFNTMAAKIKLTLDTLEQSVNDRTREVQIAAQVGKELVQKGDLRSSLKNAVEVIARDFNFYAAQVYLFEPNSQLLTLRASSGEVGEQMVQRGHRLLLGQNSLNSKAATERRVVIASDTATDPNFKANPLRPYIRSEVAVPLLDGTRLLGVLDLQSDEAGRFSNKDVTALQLLADEVTFAIRNAELLDDAEQARQGLEEQARRLTREGWQEFLNAIQRRERIETAYQTQDMEKLNAETRAVTAPIEIAGEPVGAFTVEIPAHPEDDAEVKELMQAAAQAVAQQVDNLRLIAQGEQYRAEAEEAVRRLTREGWQGYVGKAEALTEGFAYDGELVQSAHAMELDAGFEPKPLELRGEQLGEILVAKEALTPEAEQILAAVSEQLTAHIENLRLSEQTQLALMENERQNAKLATLNRVVSAASGARDMTSLLDTAAHEVLKTLRARNSGIAVFTDATRAHLKVMADANANPQDPSGVGVLIPVVGNTSTEYVLANRHSLVVEKAQTDPRTASIHELMRMRNTHSLMIVPLLSRGEIIGTIGVDSDDPNRHFSDEEVNLVETMAGQLAGSIDNLRLFEVTQKRAQREAMINEITAKIQSTVTVDSALQTTIQELGRALKARKTRVALGLTPTEPETNGHTTPN